MKNREGLYHAQTCIVTIDNIVCSKINAVLIYTVSSHNEDRENICFNIHHKRYHIHLICLFFEMIDISNNMETISGFLIKSNLLPSECIHNIATNVTNNTAWSCWNFLCSAQRFAIALVCAIRCLLAFHSSEILFTSFLIPVA